MLVIVALLFGVGVMFGMAALVVDAGYAMGQLRAMQNSADAGVLHAVKLLAGSVSKDAGGNVAYVSITDGQVHQAALDLGIANRTAGLPSSRYSLAVQYLPCPGRAAGTPNFTNASDPGLVGELGGARQSLSSAMVPGWTCALRVSARVNFSSMFGGALGRPTQGTTAQATARVYPTSPPTLITGPWPVSRWLYNDPGCTYQAGALCTFWDSNAPPGGNFKQVVNMSRYSQLALDQGIVRQQRIVDWDHTYPGNNGKLVDVPNWVRYGWGGQLKVDESDPACSTGNLACGNSRLEVYGGTMGDNIADNMRAFINDPSHVEGTDPVRGRFTTLTVFLWRYGEQGINTTTDQGSLWDSADNPNLLQRVILQKVRRFRFYESSVSSSSVKGYYVSFLTNAPPQNGPPSDTANTVALVE